MVSSVKFVNIARCLAPASVTGTLTKSSLVSFGNAANSFSPTAVTLVLERSSDVRFFNVASSFNPVFVIGASLRFRLSKVVSLATTSFRPASVILNTERSAF